MDHGTPLPVQHAALRGPHRLHNVVRCLSKSCPWTKSVSASEMLNWLRGELDELKKEMELENEMNSVGEAKSDAEVGARKKEDLVSEMGDVLFDALMLEMMVRRENNLDPDESWDAASSKVERRTPYMKEWGNGKASASTTEEAEVHWQAAKAQEKWERRERNRGKGGLETHTPKKEVRGEGMVIPSKISGRTFPWLIFARGNALVSTPFGQTLLTSGAAALAGFIAGMMVTRRR